MQRELGRTGIRVHPIGLGAMHLSLSGRPDEDTAREVLRAALDAGVTFFDTANSYCRDESEKGHNERLLGRLLRELGVWEQVTVATKGGLDRPGGSWRINSGPDAVRQACEQSLRDLGVERITLYQLHSPDTRVPLSATMDELARLQQEGRIEHIGLSNVNAEQLRTAQRTVTVQSVQNRCNPTDHDDVRNGLIDACGEAGITYIPYSPVGGGYGHRRMAGQRTLKAIGDAHGVSAYRVALAWLLGKGPHVIPIPGASRPESIADSAAAATLQLSAEEQRQIDAL